MLELQRGERVLADRGLDADGILTDIEAARAELDESWQPLALAFARLVHQHASER